MLPGLGLDLTQIQWARRVVGQIHRAGRYKSAAVCALECALAESGLRMYANANNPESLALPHDCVGHDHGSVGLFQQQVGGACNSTANWGTTAELMDVGESTKRFMHALDLTQWRARGLRRWEAVQAVQRSAVEDGSNYLAHDQHAIQLVNALW